MTANRSPERGALPGLDALHQACEVFGVDGAGARLLHHRSNAVFLLPRDGIIVRLAPGSALRQQRASTAVAVTRWLAEQPDMVALPPMPGDQPVRLQDAVATFWPYRPSPTSPTLTDLAARLRELHALPAPPAALPVPRYRPLHRLFEALDLDADRARPALPADDREWLATRGADLVVTAEELRYPLGVGLIHSDAHRDNLVYHEGRWVLIDWDATCIGPRELDLLIGLPDHFGEPESDRQRFLDAYGYDLRTWPGWTVIRDIASLHSLASYIRLAPTKPTASAELHHRLRSLRTGDEKARWHAIS
jgi:Ser/Thr protein kinase RdoA (MazF antagonist)